MGNKERFVAGLIGAVVGDALGVPVEFTSRADRDADPVTDLRGFGTHDQPPGTWSDDSSLMLCHVDSINRAGFDPNDTAKLFVEWLRRAYRTPHGKVFDVGRTTAAAIRTIEAGTPACGAGGDDERDNGNGSLMRIYPVAAYAANLEPIEAVECVSAMSAITHRHARSRLACCIFAAFTKPLLSGAEVADAYHALCDGFAPGGAFHAAISEISGGQLLRELSSFSIVLDRRLPTRARSEIGSSGYVVDTLAAAIWCLFSAASYRECVLAAVNLGDDTDTTAAVAGALAGAAYGEIPPEWQKKIVGIDEIVATARVFAELYCSEDRVPFPKSYWVVPGLVLAGEYPRNKDDLSSRIKAASLASVGVTEIIDLTEPGEVFAGSELLPYTEPFADAVARRGSVSQYTRYPIPDVGVPTDRIARSAVRSIEAAQTAGRVVYVHCLGGVGRTGTIVGCLLRKDGVPAGQVIDRIAAMRSRVPAARPSPETDAQRVFIERFEATDDFRPGEPSF